MPLDCTGGRKSPLAIYDGARTAEADGGGDTHDVASSHTSRQTHGERLKRSDARILRFVGAEQHPTHVTQPPQLHKTILQKNATFALSIKNTKKCYKSGQKPPISRALTKTGIP